MFKKLFKSSKNTKKITLHQNQAALIFTDIPKKGGPRVDYFLEFPRKDNSPYTVSPATLAAAFIIYELSKKENYLGELMVEFLNFQDEEEDGEEN